MIPEWWCHLRVGDLVTIRHGHNGRQWALVCIAPRNGSLQVKKWKANSSSWARTLSSIPCSDVIGRAWLEQLPEGARPVVQQYQQAVIAGAWLNDQESDP